MVWEMVRWDGEYYVIIVVVEGTDCFILPSMLFQTSITTSRYRIQ